jgi:hypothetical protein
MDMVKRAAILLRHFNNCGCRHEEAARLTSEDIHNIKEIPWEDWDPEKDPPKEYEHMSRSIPWEAMFTWQDTENKEDYILRAEELILLEI